MDVTAPIANGGLTNRHVTFSGGGAVSRFNAGVLRYNHSSGLPTTAAVTVKAGGRAQDMNNITDRLPHWLAHQQCHRV